MARDELAAWLRLVLTPGVGNEAARKLLAAFGLPGAVFTASFSALRAVVSERLAVALQNTPDSLEAEIAKVEQWLLPVNHHLLTLGDPNFPAALLQMADPPLMLYVVGQLDALSLPTTAILLGRLKASN